ncbi:MAG TPA: adenylate/guanylate cyclase domain-containing protein [Chloroflexia bacterium]|nr:adenylate/guanylate cyclase domain-containing protein [Chloroflexia bacterium]
MDPIQPVAASGPFCSACDTPNPAGARFCNRCGVELRDAQITLGGASGERKLVTVMFADISGFTARSERLDPEEVVTMMNACFAELDQAVGRYEGTIDKFIGDAMMVLFGAPLTHEDDAERAVRCALEMQTRLAAFSATYARPGDAPLALHIGINTGMVVAGEMGTPRRRDYTVMGDAVNLASRLESAATAGQIVIGMGTHRLVEPLFQCRPLPPLALKGKSELQQAYAVLGTTAALSARGFSRDGIRGPLIGRDRDLAVLARALADLEAGRGGVSCIVAEAGLGKSRLIAEARAGASPRLAWVTARSLAHGTSLPYHALQSAFRQLLALPPQQEAGESIAQIRTVLAQGGDGADPQLPLLWPHIVALLGYAVPDGPVAARLARLDPAARNSEFTWLLREHWRRAAGRQPTVLVFEDIHWADPATLDLVRELLPLAQDVPLHFLLLYRPETEGPLVPLRRQLEDDRRTHVLALQPLSDEHSADLVGQLLAKYHLPPELHTRLLAKAEGNPFYLEEVARSIVDSGLIGTEGGLWMRLGSVDEIVVPDSLRGLIATRVDRLSPVLKTTLQRAAVLGRHFAAPDLAGLVDEPAGLPGQLAELESRELLKPDTERSTNSEYAFKHALVQEVAYGSLLREQRRLLHRLVADHLDPQSSEPGLLAYHYERAEAWPEALTWLITAARSAYDHHAHATALDLGTRGLAAWSQVYPAADPPAAGRRAQVTLYELLATIAISMSDRAAMHQASAGLLAAGAALGDHAAQVHGYLTATHLNHLEGNWSGWEHNVDAALALATAAGDRRLLSEAYIRQARLYSSRLGAAAAIPYLRRSAAVSYLAGDLAALALATNNLSMAFQTTGATRRAAWLATYGLQISHRLGDLRLMAFNHLSVGRVALLRGQLAEGLRHMCDGQEDADRAAHVRPRIITRDHVSLAYTAIGLYEPALRLAREAGALIEEHGEDDLRPQHLATRVDALLGLGRYDEARTLLDQIGHPAPEPLGHGRAPLLWRRGLLEWLAGHPAAARASLDAALPQLPQLPGDLPAYTVWAAACLDLGDLPAAQAGIDQALRWLDEARHELETPFTCAVAAGVYTALGQPDAARRYSARAQAAFERQWAALPDPVWQAAFAARWAQRGRRLLPPDR